MTSGSLARDGPVASLVTCYHLFHASDCLFSRKLCGAKGGPIVNIHIIKLGSHLWQNSIFLNISQGQELRDFEKSGCRRQGDDCAHFSTQNGLSDPDKCQGPIITFKKSDNGLPGPLVHEFARHIWLKTQCISEEAALFFTLEPRSEKHVFDLQ